MGTVASAAIALSLATAPGLGAQAVRGIGDDAVVLPRGVMRLSVGGELDLADDRFANDASGAAIGTRVPFRSELARTLDASGAGVVASLEDRLRAATGVPDLSLGLGSLDPRATARRITVPVRLELGLGARVQMHVMVPYVQTRVVANPAIVGEANVGEANVGLNPALDDAALGNRTATLVAQFEEASAQLAAALAACADGPGASPACADPAAALATDAAAQAFAAGLADIYLPGASVSPLVPVAGSAGAQAVDGRIAAFSAAYAQLGVTAIDPATTPAHAAPPTLPDYQRVIAGADPFLAYRPLTSRSRYGIGDVEVGGRLLLFDGFGEARQAASHVGAPRLRLTAAALVRLGTGATDDPNDLLDVGIGDGQHDVEVGLLGDVAIGRAYVSVAARYGVQMAGDVDLRAAATEVLVGPDALERATRDPGDYLVLEATPRWTLGDHVSIGAHYRYVAKGADSYTGLESEDLVAALERDSEAHEHRVGAGITLSTLSDWATGRIGVPLEVSYVHSRTVAGGGTLTSVSRRDDVALRLYLGLFGRR